MKRTLATVLVGIAMLVAGDAKAEPSGDPFDGKLLPIDREKTMTAEEVNRYALPYLNRVAKCYRTHAKPARRANGELELYIVIARNGRVVHLETKAPGVPPYREIRLERCLRNEVMTWQFPMRTGFTNALLPYYFLHTKAPKAGPFPGCTKLTGCADRPNS
jgi:hypothetical protein